MSESESQGLLRRSAALIGATDVSNAPAQLQREIREITEAAATLDRSRPVLPLAQSLLRSLALLLFSGALLLVPSALGGLIAAALLGALALLPDERTIVREWELVRARLLREERSAALRQEIAEDDHVSGPIRLMLLGGVHQRDLFLVSLAPRLGRAAAIATALALAVRIELSLFALAQPIALTIASLSLLPLVIIAALREGRHAEEAGLQAILRASQRPAQDYAWLQSRISRLLTQQSDEIGEERPLSGVGR
jgi:hypothetical protein